MLHAESMTSRGWYRLVRAFFADRSGATAIEYALIAVFISIAIATAAPAIGDALVPFYERVAAAL